MPEYPDITVYVERLSARTRGTVLKTIQLRSFFLLRTVTPPLAAFHGRTVRSVARMGKRIVFDFSDDYFLVFHLMILGRLHWKESGTDVPKSALAGLAFTNGVLLLTEQGKEKRASLHAIHGADALSAIDPGGLEVLSSTLDEFRARIRSENHTLKRSLTNPTLFSGIGNAYSDEILHRARLSPVSLTRSLDDDAVARLYDAIRSVLAEWTERLRAEAGEGFPDKVTAFRPEMAVHGKYEKPCPACGTSVQRIRYASNETNYCPTCQTNGKLLADRALSRLLKSDWPSTVAELESRRRGR
ncbi:MAG: DNA-formamidopyrimidine glycosylase family protein [Spirochaetota bacterium]